MPEPRSEPHPVARFAAAPSPVEAGHRAARRSSAVFRAVRALVFAWSMWAAAVAPSCILLVDAGLTTVDALRAATSLAARHFGLTDRGAVEPGLRADLVLVDGDPIADIRATRRIRRIWCGGTEHTPAADH
ncbi:hypothetical protein Spla01_01278 [Streptomyces platensis]|uniref:Adenine deaminase n=1 Tax=Streptomyces platensis TaxID=58346 RepID=A0ABX3XNJ3_STRPT|nr:Adenine deaminase [Streptomyces platensis]